MSGRGGGSRRNFVLERFVLVEVCVGIGGSAIAVFGYTRDRGASLCRLGSAGVAHPALAVRVGRFDSDLVRA